MTFFSKALFVGAALAVLPAAGFAACPSYANPGSPLSYTDEQVWSPQAHSVTAGGNINLAECASIPGIGYIVENPDFTLQYQNVTAGRALEFRVDAACDAVLLVNTASGEWVFNDDTNGLNPAVRIASAPDGRYDVWVGTLGNSTCAAQLILESF